MTICLGNTDGRRVGIPIPKLIFIPFWTYFAALLIIFILISSSEILLEELLVVSFSIFFSEKGSLGSLLKILSTKTAGTCTSYGLIEPTGTIY
jgi:hypothetical protein